MLNNMRVSAVSVNNVISNEYDNTMHECERCQALYTNGRVNKENEKQKFLYRMEHTDGAYYVGLCPSCLRALEKFMVRENELGAEVGL